MTDTRTTLQATGAEVTAELTEAVEALRDCEETSTACAMAMAATGGMVMEVRRALDCADQCAATARILLRAAAPDEFVLDAVIDAAVAACEASAATCGPHAAVHEHCRVHAQSASACAVSLRALR